MFEAFFILNWRTIVTGMQLRHLNLQSIFKWCVCVGGGGGGGGG